MASDVRVIYVNGVATSFHEASQTKGVLASKLNAKVSLVHVPCGVVCASFQPDCHHVGHAANALSNKLIKHFNKKRSVFLVLFSKGTHVGLVALESLKHTHHSEMGERLWVSSNGGLFLLHQSLGSGVWNNICNHDDMCVTGGVACRKNGQSAITKTTPIWDDLKLIDLPLLTLRDLKRIPGYHCYEFQSKVKKSLSSLLIGLEGHSFKQEYLDEVARDFNYFIGALQKKEKANSKSENEEVTDRNDDSCEEVTDSNDDNQMPDDQDVASQIFERAFEGMYHAMIKKFMESLNIQAEKCTPEEIEHLKKLAVQGDLQAQLTVGLYLCNHNDENGVIFLWQAIDQGNLDALIILRYFHADRGDTEEAQAVTKQAAEQGHYLARLLMAIDLMGSQPEQAFELINKLAVEGGKEAQLLVGIWTYKTKQDLETAAEWFYKASVQGLEGADTVYAQVCTDLAKRYACGQKVAEDPRLAFKWCKKGARNGNLDAKWALSLYYEEGYGTPCDPDKARKWRKEAAQGGHPKAIEALNKSKQKSNKRDEDCTIF
ncbi:MAG: tetratricopeptide repeat protein [Parachlamydiales bacterium]